MHCALDDAIPFSEWALIPYLLVRSSDRRAGVYLFQDVLAFPADDAVHHRHSIRLRPSFISSTRRSSCCGPEAFAHDNALTRAVAWFYTFDTNTNVCPSLHVIGSAAALFPRCDGPRLRKRAWWQAASVLLALCISLSTVFMKQHSILDVLCALPVCALGWWPKHGRTDNGAAETSPGRGDPSWETIIFADESARRTAQGIIGIAAHIEREKRVASSRSQMKTFVHDQHRQMRKRLGFDGYSEFYYHLSRQLAFGDRKAENLKSLIDNYDDALVERFCALPRAPQRKMFTTGEGFSTLWGPISRSANRSAALWRSKQCIFTIICSFREAHSRRVNDEAAVMFAVSQSGETELVLNDVRHAKQHGHKIVTFTRRGDSTLAQLSDLVFVLDGTQSRRSPAACRILFGHVILVFEDLMARYFERKESV